MEYDTELAVLENLYGSAKADSRQAPTQRSLAASAGLSLGMTNVLLKRFSEKGWVTVKRVNARNLQYALTSEGVQEIARRTYRYMKRTARNASLYRDILEEYALSAKRDGVRTLVLAGPSELDFILEYVCDRHALLFLKTADPPRALSLMNEGTRILVSERAPDDFAPPGSNSLKAILTGNGALAAAEESE
jgi:DNA-binding MarR family transcriptional regulator